MRVVYIVMGKNQLTGEVLIPEFVDDEATGISIITVTVAGRARPTR
jgi:hypothetical protein